MITRRQIITAVSSASLFGAYARGAETSKTTARVGFLAPNSPEIARVQFASFQQVLRDRGWVEGQNIRFESRYADGERDRLFGLATELVRLNVDIILTGSSSATRAAKDATRSIPIVMGASADALGEGFVTSLARPGGNITGMTFLAGTEIARKQFELLQLVAVNSHRVAVLANPENASHAASVRDLYVVARTLGTELHVVEARHPRDLPGSFASIVKARVDAILVLTDSMFFGQRRSVVELASKGAIPAMYSQREFVAAGGLVSYGPSVSDMFQRAAMQVDKILKGVNPSDIPVEQPTKFELIINLGTAKALGLAVPQSVLLRADEIVE